MRRRAARNRAAQLLLEADDGSIEPELTDGATSEKLAVTGNDNRLRHVILTLQDAFHGGGQEIGL